MTGYQEATLFVDQLGRHTGVKVVLAPTPIKEAGALAKVFVRKVIFLKRTQGERASHPVGVKLRVSVEGRVEGSDVALKQCLDDQEAIARYLAEASYLEDPSGTPIIGSRIESARSEDDSMLEDPENGAVAWASDDHLVTVSAPSDWEES